jgi:N-acetylneuraminate lyase
MKNNHLQGLIAAPFTPMYENGSLNPELIPSYYQMLKTNGVKGAFICGSTGEGVSLTQDEKKIVAEAWANASASDNEFKVIMLVGGNSIADCIEMALYSKAIGLYAVAFTSPSYFKPADTGMLASCCERIAEAVPDLPFYYYHIPVLTGANFQMYELLQAIDGRIRNFAGVKYTHEDFMDFLSCFRYKNQKYDMLWGRDENMLSALVLGATGAVGSTFNYAAPLYHELIKAFNGGELERAQALQQKSIDMIRLLGKYGGIATGKAYMKLMGLDCGSFRLPVKNMSVETFDIFSDEVRRLAFDEFKSVMPQKAGLQVQ